MISWCSLVKSESHFTRKNAHKLRKSGDFCKGFIPKFFLNHEISIRLRENRIISVFKNISFPAVKELEKVGMKKSGVRKRHTAMK